MTAPIDRETHARLFARYLGSASLADLRAIVEDAEDCARANLNGGIREQVRIAARMRANIDAAVNRMLETDLQYAEKLLHKRQKVCKL